MASATAAQQRPAMRIASRRALLLLQKTRDGAKQQQPGGGGSSSPLVPPKKPEEAPWPDSVRYPFYAFLAASAPFAAGQALALSPRLRESVLGDCDDDDDDDDHGYGGRVLSWVRRTWGREEYVPPVDLVPSLAHAIPGHRNSWQEDDYSSLLEMFGLYHRRGDDVVVLRPAPSSLDDEPPHRIRREQASLSRTLSDPSGVRAKLTLLPPRVAAAASSSGAIPYDDDDDDIDTDATAAYETERSFPGSVSASVLRGTCTGSDARSVVQELLAAGGRGGGGTNNYERIRTGGWDEECRWAVTFPDIDGGGDPEGEEEERERNATAWSSRNDDCDDGASSSSSAAAAAAMALSLRRNTAIRSSWTHFPDAAVVAAPPLASSLGSVGASASVSSSAGGNNAPPPAYDAKSLLVQGLEYRVSALEGELQDPSSMRDRDDMREELASARRELRSLKPWWRRGWGW